ncbi:MAG: hypothetical protein PVI57_11640 [Gemmatimonadota bacterium]
MRILIGFWRSLAVWTAFIAILLGAVTLLTGSGARVMAQVPLWLGMAFTLAAYPAGVAVSGAVLRPDHGRRGVTLGLFAGSAVGASVLAFLLLNWVAPALLSPSAAPGFPEAAGMTLGQLAERLGAAAPRDSGGTAADWLTYNHLAYHFVRRTDGMVLPALFACVGLLTGPWARRLPPATGRAALWGMGLFLTVTTYLAGENGYELIVLRMAGPAEFAADLVLIVPGTLILALALPTIADLLGGGDPSAAP